MSYIQRYYPSKKTIQSYPNRRTNADFETAESMRTNVNLQNDFSKWKDGINYITNRTIKKGLKLHNELKYKFIVKGDLFDTYNNKDEYLNETKRLHTAIDRKNNITEKYNKLVDAIIIKINNLKCWWDFVPFEGMCYGLPHKVLDNIHRVEDCFGEMLFTHKKESIREGNCRPFMICPDTITIWRVYKCVKCNSEHDVKERSYELGGYSISY